MGLDIPLSGHFLIWVRLSDHRDSPLFHGNPSWWNSDTHGDVCESCKLTWCNTNMHMELLEQIRLEIPPRKLTCPRKRDHFNRKFHLPTIDFKGYVSFQWGSFHMDSLARFAWCRGFWSASGDSVPLGTRLVNKHFRFENSCHNSCTVLPCFAMICSRLPPVQNGFT